mmetsp:Transcript_34170/g.88217  ORF Transcript_34170/g.88217 Transcript_34170/m.88217 type:complete len:86 (+) Transcript_34170:29-286(+)
MMQHSDLERKWSLLYSHHPYYQLHLPLFLLQARTDPSRPSCPPEKDLDEIDKTTTRFYRKYDDMMWVWVWVRGETLKLTLEKLKK